MPRGRQNPQDGLGCGGLLLLYFAVVCALGSGFFLLVGLFNLPFDLARCRDAGMEYVWRWNDLPPRVENGCPPSSKTGYASFLWDSGVTFVISVILLAYLTTP